MQVVAQHLQATLDDVHRASDEFRILKNLRHLLEQTRPALLADASSSFQSPLELTPFIGDTSSLIMSWQAVAGAGAGNVVKLLRAKQQPHHGKVEILSYLSEAK